MIRNAQLAREFTNLILSEGDLSLTKDMLKESWEVKRCLNPDSITPQLEDFYKFALDGGASAGKILGAGGGGFFLFWVAPEKQEKFNEKMKKFIKVPVKISKTGSRRIV